MASLSKMLGLRSSCKRTVGTLWATAATTLMSLSKASGIQMTVPACTDGNTWQSRRVKPEREEYHNHQ